MFTQNVFGSISQPRFRFIAHVEHDFSNFYIEIGKSNQVGMTLNPCIFLYPFGCVMHLSASSYHVNKRLVITL